MPDRIPLEIPGQHELEIDLDATLLPTELIDELHAIHARGGRPCRRDAPPGLSGTGLATLMKRGGKLEVAP